MRNFYLALVRYRDHLLFILILIISIILLFNNESPNISILRGKATDLFSVFSKPVKWFRSIAILEEEAAVLREENLLLSLRLESMVNLEEDNTRLREILNYKRDSQLQMIPAQVTNKGISANMNTLTIDVGSAQGVQRNMAVITPNAVVGKTIAVGRHSSVVQIISDVNFRLSVQILPSRARGILRWVYGDLCEIREVQKNFEVNVGDRVLTSGFSDIYPKNLPVGEIIGFRDERNSFQKIITVKIAEQLGSLMNVFVIAVQEDVVQ